MSLKDLLLTSYPSAGDRDRGAFLIHQNPKYFTALLKLASAPEDNRENILAAWIMEKYAVDQPECLESHFTLFLEGTLQQKNDSKRRPFAKLLYHYCKSKSRRELLTHQNIDSIVEICFNYMLESQKAAPLAFAMKTLHFFKNHKAWIAEELNGYIEKKLPNSSAGFRSVVRQIS